VNCNDVFVEQDLCTRLSSAQVSTAVQYAEGPRLVFLLAWLFLARRKLAVETTIENDCALRETYRVRFSSKRS
jgi:hypothetical protein